MLPCLEVPVPRASVTRRSRSPVTADHRAGASRHPWRTPLVARTVAPCPSTRSCQNGLSQMSITISRIVKHPIKSYQNQIVFTKIPSRYQIKRCTSRRGNASSLFFGWWHGSKLCQLDHNFTLTDQGATTRTHPDHNFSLMDQGATT